MRLLATNIPDNKKIETSLTYLFGIGQVSAKKILKAANVENKRTKDITPEELNRIKGAIEKNYKVEGELKQLVKSNIARLKEVRCYRGVRHERRLPVRGQRTKTNSRTVRGNVRKTAGSGKRKVDLK